MDVDDWPAHQVIHRNLREQCDEIDHQQPAYRRVELPRPALVGFVDQHGNQDVGADEERVDEGHLLEENRVQQDDQQSHHNVHRRRTDPDRPRQHDRQQAHQADPDREVARPHRVGLQVFEWRIEQEHGAEKGDRDGDGTHIPFIGQGHRLFWLPWAWMKADGSTIKRGQRATLAQAQSSSALDKPRLGKPSNCSASSISLMPTKCQKCKGASIYLPNQGEFR
jgi:hypothetical protein